MVAFRLERLRGRFIETDQSLAKRSLERNLRFASRNPKERFRRDSTAAKPAVDIVDGGGNEVKRGGLRPQPVAQAARLRSVPPVTNLRRAA